MARNWGWIPARFRRCSSGWKRPASSAASRDKGDERQVIVALTEKGVALKSDAFGILMEIGKATGCSMKEAAALRSALHDLNRHLDQNQSA